MSSSSSRFSLSMRFGLLVLGLAVALAVAVALKIKNDQGGSGVALVGGPFTMVNQRGETVTDKTFLGKPTLLFFGFTYCPDVCPTELQVMAAALEQLGDKGEDIQPIFVSIDPARDTPAIVASYVSNFGDRFVGLTGTAQQVANIASQYRVFYAKQDNPKDPQNYQMDHSSIIYLMGPDGKFLKHFSYTTDAKALAEGLKLALGR